MECVLGAVEGGEVDVIRKVCARDVVDITPADAPFGRVEDVACVCGCEVALCGAERVVPIPVSVETNPAFELRAVGAADVGWPTVGLRVCYPDLGEVFSVEVEGIDPGVAFECQSCFPLLHTIISFPERRWGMEGMTYKCRNSNPSISAAEELLG